MRSRNLNLWVFYTKCADGKYLVYEKGSYRTPKRSKIAKQLAKIAWNDKDIKEFGWMLQSQWDKLILPEEIRYLDGIIFNDRSYPLRYAYIKETRETVTIGTESLSKALCPTGHWNEATDHATRLDESIYYYVGDEIIDWDQKALNAYVNDNA